MLTAIILIAIAITAILFPNEAKMVIRWSVPGLRGLAQDAKALRTEAKTRLIDDPDYINKGVQQLNTTVCDTRAYHKEACTRNKEALKANTAALDALK